MSINADILYYVKYMPRRKRVVVKNAKIQKNSLLNTVKKLAEDPPQRCNYSCRKLIW